MDKTDVMTDMMAASHALSLGLAGVLHSLLPEHEEYKIEVLLETYNDSLERISKGINE